MMNPAETRHLFVLAGRSAPVEIEKMEETPSPSLLRILHKFNMPAVLLGSRWDVLAINDATKKQFPMLVELPDSKTNWLHFFFQKLDTSTIANWDTAARQLISDFRSSMSDALDQPWVTEIVDSLRKENPNSMLTGAIMTSATAPIRWSSSTKGTLWGRGSLSARLCVQPKILA